MDVKTYTPEERLQDNNLTTEKYGRWLSMFDPSKHKEKKIWVIGTGWVGSAALICLTKMGLHCKTCDFDTVGIENTSSQMFWEKDIGRPKTEAIADICKLLCDMDIEYKTDKYDKEYFSDCDILVMAVDDNKIRKQIVDEASDEQFIIDAWQVKSMFNLYSFFKWQKPEDWDELNKEEEGWEETTLCTEKATSFLSFGTASFIGAAVTNVLNEEYDLVPYRLCVDLKHSNLFT